MKSVPFRRRLYVLVAAGFLPVAVAAAIGLLALFAQQRSQAEVAALEITRALASAVDAELRQSTAVLEVLATSTPFDRGEIELVRERMMRTAAIHQDDWYGLILFDPQGRQVVNTRIPPGEPMPDVVDRASLDAVLKSGQATVGFVTKGRQGNWAVPLRVPVIREGRTVFVLTAPIRPESFLRVISRPSVREGWVVTAADRRGNRVFRSPRQAEYVGTPVSGTLGKMQSTGASEGTGLTTTSEGTEVYTAFTRSPVSGWTVALGIPRDQVEAAAYQSAAAFGSGIVLSLLAGLLTALLVARAISRPMLELRTAAQDAGEGRVPQPVRTDVREIQDVSSALVAAARQRREAEAQREALLQSEQAARGAAEDANRAKDEFLAMLGHELRNPLGAVANAAAVLDHPGAADPARQAARKVIARQVAHLSRLTDDLLDAGRAVLGKIELQREPLDLAAVARQALESLEASGRTRRHRIVTDLRPAWVMADPIRMDQVVGNLVSNAVKFTPEGGHIRVEVGRVEGDAVLRVCDEGIGISRELAPRVFDLFVQGERPLDRSAGGLGIGLTLVRRLAEMHGGHVELASEGEGRGSEFTVRIPAIEAPTHEAPGAPAGTARTHDILVVEDHEDARETLETLLRFQGHHVRTASDGLSGLAAALRDRPRVMLVDLGLPGIDGLELARRVRADGGWAERPTLVALTGYGQEEDRERALAAGFDAHVTKPVSMDALDALLARVAPTSPRGPSAGARP